MRYNRMPECNDPPPRIPERWQKQLTALLGVNPRGEPKLRLVWGQTAKQFFMEQERLRYIRSHEPVFTGWRESAKNEAGEMVEVNRHPPTLEPPQVPEGHLLEPLGRMRTLGIDRWFIELWRGPHSAGGGHTPQSWNREFRYKHLFDPKKGIYRNVDVFGEFPYNGVYATAPFRYPWMISRHDRQQVCCNERKQQGLPCFGEYREPEQRDVDYLEFLIREKEKEPYLSGYDETAPIETFAQEISDDLWRERRKEEAEDAENRDLIDRLVDRLARQPVYFDIRRH